MKKILFLLLCGCGSMQTGLAQVAKIFISGEFPENQYKEKLIVECYPLDEVFGKGHQQHILKVRRQRIDTALLFSPPVVLVQKSLLGKTSYLLEDSDSIVIQYKNRKLSFSGVGAEKFSLTNRIYKVQKKALRKTRVIARTVADYMQTDSITKRQIMLCNKLLESNRSSLSSFAYSYLKGELLASRAPCVKKFLSLLYNRNELSLSENDLIQIYDSTIARNDIPMEKIDISHPSLSLTGYFFSLNRAADARENRFSNTYLNAVFADQTVSWYYRAKKRFAGVIREDILKYIATSWMIKRGGFTASVEKALQDYYALPGFPEYRKFVKDYELARRNAQLSANAPAFSVVDKDSNQVTLSQFAGKTVLLHFWHTGCENGQQVKRVMRKVKKELSGDTTIVFAEISVDTSRDLWLRSIEADTCTTNRVFRLFTDGRGKQHPIVSHYGITRFPEIRIIGPAGTVASPGMNMQPKVMAGAIMEAVYQQKAVAFDGPYVFYKGNEVVVKSILPGSQAPVIKKEVVANHQKEDIVLEVMTDHPHKTFSFKLKQNIESEPSVFPAPDKVLVFSDIEGNFTAFKKLLIANKVIDTAYNWAFGNGHLVLVGDFFDRGTQVTECLWLIYALEEVAKKAGGYVHFILGNHEIMNLSGNTKYVQRKYKNNMKLMEEQYEQVFGESTELGRWLRTKNIMEKIGEVLYVHGGIHPEVNKIPLNIEQINNLVRPYYSSGRKSFDSPYLNLLYYSRTSPFWYRDYYEQSEDRLFNMSQIDSTLEKFGVHRIVTGHTIVDNNISSHFNNKVINVDTRHAEGHSEALLIEGDNYYRVNSAAIKVPLFRHNIILSGL